MRIASGGVVEVLILADGLALLAKDSTRLIVKRPNDDAVAGLGFLARVSQKSAVEYLGAAALAGLLGDGHRAQKCVKSPQAPLASCSSAASRSRTATRR